MMLVEFTTTLTVNFVLIAAVAIWLTIKENDQ